MSKRLYNVTLTPEQKARLETLGYQSSDLPVRYVVNARALLKSAAGQSDISIAESLDLAMQTVTRLRKRFCDKGLDACLERAEQPNRARKITGDIEAHIARIACGSAPDGRVRWTLDLLVERIIELKILPEVGRSSVARTFKKTRPSLGSPSASASRPSATASS